MVALHAFSPCLSISWVIMIITGFNMPSKVVSLEIGVLVAETPSDATEFCVVYMKTSSPLSETKRAAQLIPLIDRRMQDSCKKLENSSTHEGKIVLIPGEHNCSLVERAYSEQKLGGKGLLVAVSPGYVRNIYVNPSALEVANITVALISISAVEILQKMFPNVTVKMFSPKYDNADLSLIIIWTMAVSTVVVGAFWSGIVAHNTSKVKKRSEIEEKTNHRAALNASEEESFIISPLLITMYTISMVVTLLLIYFFFSNQYYLYFVIATFALTSSISVYICLDPLYQFFNSECTCRDGLFKSQICRVFIAIGLSVAWIVLRREDYSWVLQDCLFVSCCLCVLKYLRFPNLKLCTILLVFQFFCETLIAFIPHFKAKSEITLIEDTICGTAKQMLPALCLPRLRLDPLSACYLQYSCLHFDDILYPGFLISFCYGMDFQLKIKSRLYYRTTLISYGCGLIMAFIGQYLMNMPQPELLYLIPATVIPLLMLSSFRGEINIMWTGVKLAKPQVTA